MALSPGPRRQRKLAASLAASLATSAIFAAVPARALNFFELEVYPYQTEGAGVAEFESLNSIAPKGHHRGDEGAFPTDSLYRSSLEATYGFGEKIEAAAYLDLVHPDGASMQYAGSRYRLRGSLFEKGEMPLDLGWYAELEWRRTPEFGDNQLEVDLRPILERDVGRITVSVDPIFEKALAGPDRKRGFEFDYAAKTSYRWAALLSPGLEFYGDIGHIDDSDPLARQQHYIFPVVDMHLPGRVNANLGVGFGLTRASDRIIVKINLELERLLGPLF